MKRLLLVLTFLVSSSLYFSQEYIPFPDSVASWAISHHEYSFEDNINSTDGIIYHIKGDTLINDTLYSKLFIRISWFLTNSEEYIFYPTEYGPGTLVGGIREDANKKVWFRNLNFENFSVDESGSWINNDMQHWSALDVESLLMDSTEFMIYDFGLELGDSVYFREHLFFEDHWETVVDVSYDVLGRRTITFSQFKYWNNSRIWVEGIGDINGSLLTLITGTKVIGFGITFIDDLTCFSQNDELIYSDGNEEIEPICLSSFTGVSELRKNNISISPNPSNGIFTIDVTEGNDISIQVFDLLGNVIKEEKSIRGATYQLDISDQANGVYYVNVLMDNKKKMSGKIVKL